MRFLILLFAGTLYAQTAVEYGLGAGRAATTTAPARGLGKSVAGAFGSLDKTLKSGQTSEKPAVEVITVSTSSKVAPPVPAKNYEDIARAEVGLAYDDLVERFGPPSLEVAGSGETRKLTYAGKAGSTQIEVKEGKVSAINAPKPPAGVFTLPSQR